MDTTKDIIKTPFKGKFLKRCPGTPVYRCCNYYVLNIQNNCVLDCHYCILQDYINSNKVTVFTNVHDALNEVSTVLDSNPDHFYRIGTGELTDSLCLDHITNHSLTLVPFFNNYRNSLLELKTKTANISNLLKLKPKSNIVIAWSLNPQYIIDKYEWRTANLEQRLEAAQQCAKRGYKIAFHLDPIIFYSKWEKGYRDLINQIPKYVPSENIVWISVAGFRYSPRLKTIIQERFPESRLFCGEMIRAQDGKYRYLRPLRVNVYKKIISWIMDWDQNIPVYFCMENPVVWQEVFGSLPENIPNLKGIFGDTWWGK